MAVLSIIPNGPLEKHAVVLGVKDNPRVGTPEDQQAAKNLGLAAALRSL
jgi:hypothetical protein